MTWTLGCPTCGAARALWCLCAFRRLSQVRERRTAMERALRLARNQCLAGSGRTEVEP